MHTHVNTKSLSLLSHTHIHVHKYTGAGNETGEPSENEASLIIIAMGCLKLQVISRKRATNHRALLRKMKPLYIIIAKMRVLIFAEDLIVAKKRGRHESTRTRTLSRRPSLSHTHVLTHKYAGAHNERGKARVRVPSWGTQKSESKQKSEQKSGQSKNPSLPTDILQAL